MPGPPPPAQLARRGGVDLAQRLVELAHAGEAGRERDIGQRQVGRLDEHAGRVGAPCPGQGQRCRSELLGEQPTEVARGVAHPPGQPVHALAVDQAVGDQPHRATGDIGGDVPLGAARRRVGQAPLAGAVARGVRTGGGGVEGDVRRSRGAGRARGPAVDPGGADGGVEHAVEAPVPAPHRAVARLGVEVSGRRHATSLTGAGAPAPAENGHGRDDRSPESGEDAGSGTHHTRDRADDLETALARLGVGLLLAGALAGCGGESDGDSSAPSTSPEPAGATLDPAALDGTTYTSTSVEGRELVSGSAIELAFEDDTMSVWAGCNSMFGVLRGGRHRPRVEHRAGRHDDDVRPRADRAGPVAHRPAHRRCHCHHGRRDPHVGGGRRHDRAGECVVGGRASTACWGPPGPPSAPCRTAPSPDFRSTPAAPGSTWGTTAWPVSSPGAGVVAPPCASRGRRSTFANTTVQRGRCTGPARQTERAVLDLLDGPSDNAELHDHLLVVTREGRGLFFEVTRVGPLRRAAAGEPVSDRATRG